MRQHLLLDPGCVDNGLQIAVRSGGHSASGHSGVDDGIVIDLSQMKRIDVDPDTQTTRCQPGLTWAEFDGATQVHGLAVTGGRFSTTGIAGLLLGSKAPESDLIASVTFVTILMTILIQAPTTEWLGRRLGLIAKAPTKQS